jgi:PrtD family type I secretion system ABC transporter
VAEFLRVCRRYFVHVGIFSFFMNLLMLTMPIYMMQIFQRVITSRSIETLVLLTMAALLALLLFMVLDMFRSRLLLGAGVALDGLTGPRVLHSLVSSIVRPGGDKYISGLRDVAQLRNFVTGQGITSLFDAPWMPVYLFVIYLFHPLLGVMATLGAAALFLLAWLNEKLTRGPLQETSNASARAGRYIDAGLRNAEVVNALGMIANLTGRWQNLNARVIDAQAVAGVRGGVIQSASRFLRLAIQILMLGVGAGLVINQHVSAGIMVAATLILSRALAPVESAIVTWRGLVEARQAYHRLNGLLLETPVQDAQSVDLPRPSGRLELEGVTFAIPGQDRLIIKGVSFRLDAGESIGVIGPSAAGKSTLARLVSGIWRPANGAVRLDGADVSTWPRDDLGRYMGYLPQAIELFAGTVGDNIARLGKAESGEIIAAARRAHAHEMIMRLPKAYDTEVGEGGVALSAGQRQRIGLARALFGNPSLVILDEPNANLDTEGEVALLATLKELAEQSVTCLTITHKPSLLSGVTKLLVLNDGRVEMFGPRAEIMARVTRVVAPAASGETPVAAVADRKQF